MLWLHSFVTKITLQHAHTCMTGGLGTLMVPDEFEVWLCVDLHAYSSCSTQIDPFCFTYSEVDGVFVPWAFNSSLRLEKVAASTRRMIPNRNRDYSKLSPTHHITETSGENDVYKHVGWECVCVSVFVCECVCVNSLTYTPTKHSSAPFQGKASSGQHQHTWPQDSGLSSCLRFPVCVICA
jgi:hypothetical protein